MSLNDFELGKQLGKGAFGSVWIVRRKEDGKIYAMKRVNISLLGKKEKENSFNEVRLLASLRHKNIIDYNEAFFDEKTAFLNIVMEFADDGDLASKIKDMKKKSLVFEENTIWQTLIQILEGLQYLHEKSIIHRDLKCANIFLTKDGCVKIGDLNVSKFSRMGVAVTQTGTPYYAAPEIWNDKPYDYKCDIWSVGCIIYEMAELHVPFRGTSLAQLYNNVIKGVFPPLNDRYSDDLKKIIKSILVNNSFKRPSATELLNCDIIKNKKIELGMEIDDANTNFKDEGLKTFLMKTIKIPRNLSLINKQLPKKRYKKEDQANNEMLENDEYETAKKTFYHPPGKENYANNKGNNDYGYNNMNEKQIVEKILSKESNNLYAQNFGSNNSNNNYLNNNLILPDSKANKCANNSNLNTNKKLKENDSSSKLNYQMQNDEKNEYHLSIKNSNNNKYKLSPARKLYDNDVNCNSIKNSGNNSSLKNKLNKKKLYDQNNSLQSNNANNASKKYKPFKDTAIKFNHLANVIDNNTGGNKNSLSLKAKGYINSMNSNNNNNNNLNNLNNNINELNSPFRKYSAKEELFKNQNFIKDSLPSISASEKVNNKKEKKTQLLNKPFNNMALDKEDNNNDNKLNEYLDDKVNNNHHGEYSKKPSELNLNAEFEDIEQEIKRNKKALENVNSNLKKYELEKDQSSKKLKIDDPFASSLPSSNKKTRFINSGNKRGEYNSLNNLDHNNKNNKNIQMPHRNFMKNNLISNNNKHINLNNNYINSNNNGNNFNSNDYYNKNKYNNYSNKPATAPNQMNRGIIKNNRPISSKNPISYNNHGNNFNNNHLNNDNNNNSNINQVQNKYNYRHYYGQNYNNYLRLRNNGNINNYGINSNNNYKFPNYENRRVVYEKITYRRNGNERNYSKGPSQIKYVGQGNNYNMYNRAIIKNPNILNYNYNIGNNNMNNNDDNNNNILNNLINNNGKNINNNKFNNNFINSNNYNNNNNNNFNNNFNNNYNNNNNYYGVHNLLGNKNSRIYREAPRIIIQKKMIN